MPHVHSPPCCDHFYGIDFSARPRLRVLPHRASPTLALKLGLFEGEIHRGEGRESNELWEKESQAGLSELSPRARMLKNSRLLMICCDSFD